MIGDDVAIARADPEGDDARRCLAAYFAEIDERFADGFDPARGLPTPAAAGATSVRLETNRTLVEAIALYRSSGYVEVAAFNDERYADHWFAKDLP